MEYKSRTNGWMTFREHWSFALVALLAMCLTMALDFFFNLHGKPWIYVFCVSVVLLLCGAALILRAKIPAYRSGRFFTFGVNSVPERLAGSYRRGWRIFLFGVVLSLCLLLSR